jgi:hypothetical protein
LARNRYGWEKRAKEMARKQKNDEKMKRRQGKAGAPATEVHPEAVDDLNQNSSPETELTNLSLRQES